MEREPVTGKTKVNIDRLAFVQCALRPVREQRIFAEDPKPPIHRAVQPAPAREAAPLVQRSTPPRRTPHTFWIGEESEETLADKNSAPIPVKLRPKSDADMRRELAQFEERGDVLLEIPPSDPREAVAWWLKKNMMSAATCRRTSLPQLCMDLRGKGVVLSEKDANQHLWMLEHEEVRQRKSVQRR